MEGSPQLQAKAATLLKVKLTPYERDEAEAQAARISAVYHDKTEKSAPKATVGPRDSLRKRILAMSLFPNIYNHKSLQHTM
jgi:hypothetical protein